MNNLTIQPLSPQTATAVNQAESRPGPAAGPGFKQLFDQAVGTVNDQLQAADRLAQGLASGQHANIHETMIAMEKASISFRMLTRVQQKAVEAYQEIMRLQL